MGQQGTAKCSDCGEEFVASIGGGFELWQLRCVDCDADAFVRQNVQTEDFKMRCSKCGGAMRYGLMPRCPKCGSRNTKMHRVQTYWD
jgi:Zn finger protein HypA/HybF involved in hydrogenase expression